MKHFILILVFLFTFPGFTPAVAEEGTFKRRPDKTEFVTESHVRLTTESLKIAEVTPATPTPATRQSFWAMLGEAWQSFVAATKALFN